MTFALRGAIRAALAFALGQFFVGNLYAQTTWAPIVSFDGMTISADTLQARLQRVGASTLKVLISTVFPQDRSMPGEPSKTYRQRVSLVELRCSTLTFRAVTAWAYSAAGAVVASADQSNSAFEPSQPGSLEHQINSRICDFGTGRTTKLERIVATASTAPLVPEVIRGALPNLPVDAAPVDPGAPRLVVESRIDGEFEGWDGESLFRLMNGQVWQQSSYAYHYTYSFNPRVRIYRSGTRYIMEVERVSRTIQVTRLK